MSRVASWVTGGIAGLFAEDLQGEMRPSGQQVTLPGSQAAKPAEAAKQPPGKRVKEQTGKRSQFGKVYELEDGRSQVELSTRPVHYKDADGNWQDVDTRIEAVSEDGFVQGNGKAGYSTRFGDKTDKLAKIKLGERQLTFGVAGDAKQVAPVVKGSTVTYPGVWDGTDLMYTVTPSGVKEYLVLSKPPASGTAYSFTVKTGGVSAQQNADGSIAFNGEDGTPVFTVPKPFMIDSEVDVSSPYGKRYSDAVTQAVTQQGSEATITLTPDAGWLAAPERKWPVVIDPTINLPDWANPTQDTYVDAGAASSNFVSSWMLPVGKSASGVKR